MTQLYLVVALGGVAVIIVVRAIGQIQILPAYKHAIELGPLQSMEGVARMTEIGKKNLPI